MSFSSCINENVSSLLAEFTETFVLADQPHTSTPSEFNALLRGIVPPRGERFNHDYHDTCMYITRSKNANIVAYTVNLESSFHAQNKGKAADDTSKKEDTANRKSSTPDSPINSNFSYYSIPTTSKGSLVLSGKGAECEINVDNPIHAYFISLEPSYLKERRRKGLNYDCDDLSLIERKLAYGYRHKILHCHNNLDKLKELLPSKTHTVFAELNKEQMSMVADWWSFFTPIVIQFVAAAGLPCILLRLSPIKKDTSPPAWVQSHGTSSFSDEDTLSVIVSKVDGQLCVMERAYIMSIERFMRFPKVEYVDIFGVSLITGEIISFRWLNKGKHSY
ncbi:unnamed protein product [Phytomonas sp. Hart1]|nr:unnamed protein product [Phytomonas sp. Hart1]|eukprot:CCW70298.1 unnamed protein product [Phytomonas sp. isolate Hart1]